MRRRLASLLLTALVVLTGIAVGACPLGRCLGMQPAPAADPHAGHAMQSGHDGHAGMQHADAGHAMHHVAQGADGPSHACCDRDGVTNPPCCPESGQLAQQRATPSGDRTSHAIQLVATVTVPASLAAFVRTAIEPPRPVPLGAPPGTLVTQHTSLLV